MSAFPCPYCGHALAAETKEERRDRCSSCDGLLLIAYRYRLVAQRGMISGGLLYEATDDGFGEKVAVLFVEDPSDTEAVDRFIEGNRLFTELGGRGLVKLRELGGRGDRRPYVVMDWIAGGTLEAVVGKRGTLDAALMAEITRDLLTGLSKAHRSMPPLVHGHVHPGKIGFLTADQAVLFGFEWAQRVSDGPRKFADSFIAKPTAETGPHRITDLHQLGRALYYAATGEWIADKGIAQQRVCARERLTGALGQSVDRMLGAGADGYESAIDAVTDFDALLRGQSRWKPTIDKLRDRSGDLSAPAWTANHDDRVKPPNTAFDNNDDDDDDDIDDDIDDDHIIDDDDIIEQEVFAPPSASTWTSSPAATPVRTTPTPVAAAFAEAARRRELMAQIADAQPPTHNPVKIAGVVIASMVVFGMCVSAISGNNDDNFAQRSATVPRGAPEPFTPPRHDPPPPSQPEPFAVEEADIGSLSGLHYYTGTVTGPEDLAGLALGDRCEIWVEPNSGSLNCRWFIDCGKPARRIYGGGTAGFSTCSVHEGHPVWAQDEDDDVSDGAFVATLTEIDPMIMVVDRWMLPPTRVAISIDEGGGPHLNPAPDLDPKRMSDSAIEAAIESGEDPVFGDNSPPEQLSNTQILEVLEANIEALRECTADEEYDLDLTISVEIRKNGRVGKVASSPSSQRSVEACLAGVLRRTRFPVFTGEAMSINWNVTL